MSIGQESNAEKMDISVCLRLKEAREMVGASQADVARAAGVSTKTAWRWEKGTPIPADRLGRLSDIRIDIAYVVTGRWSSVASIIAADLNAAKKELVEYERKISDFFGVSDSEMQDTELARRAEKIANDFRLLGEDERLAVEAMMCALSKKNDSDKREG